MSFMMSIKKALGIAPEGPEYSVDDLSFHSERFVQCIDGARQDVESLASSRLDDVKDVRLPSHMTVSEAIGKVRFTFMWNYKSWMDDEFIPMFRTCRRHAAGSFRASDAVSGRGAIGHAESCLRAAERHARDVSAALHFMLCDTRSTFVAAKAVQGCDGVRERCRWMMDGKRIVDDNMDRMISALRDLVDLFKDRR